MNWFVKISNCLRKRFSNRQNATEHRRWINQSEQELLEFIRRISPNCQLLAAKIKKSGFQLIEFWEYNTRHYEYYEEDDYPYPGCSKILAVHLPEMNLSNTVVLSRGDIQDILRADNNDSRRIEFYIAHEIGHLITWDRISSCASYKRLSENGKPMQCFSDCRLSELLAHENGLRILAKLCGSVKKWLEINSLAEAEYFWQKKFLPHWIHYCNLGCSKPKNQCPKIKAAALSLGRIKKLFFQDYK